MKNACVYACIYVLYVYIRSWCFLPVELFTCPSPAPLELCARACFFYRPPISVSVTHFTSTPRPANTVGGDVKKTHIRAFDINTRRLENIHSLIECFIVELEAIGFIFAIYFLRFYGYRLSIKENCNFEDLWTKICLSVDIDRVSIVEKFEELWVEVWREFAIFLTHFWLVLLGNRQLH